MRYIDLYLSGELKKRASLAEEYLNNCNICPNNCYISRIENKMGACYSRYLPIVSSYTLHFGEEPALVGENGVGNIFFGNCNLKCKYCQNFEISQNYKNEIKNEVTFERLAEIMLELQEKKANAIGLVSPTHFVPQILKSLVIAIEKGLRIPLVYNSNGYDSVEMLKLLDGIIDIYLPDIKYGNNDYSKEFSGIKNYFNCAKLAVKEMYRQKGYKIIYNDKGVVTSGLIIRHLVLPNDLAETEEVLKFIANELDNRITVSLMSQYNPLFKANNIPLLSRKLRYSEYERAITLLEKYNITNGWLQELESSDNYLPNFNKNRENPFGI